MKQMLFHVAIGLGAVSLLFLAGSVRAFRRRLWIGRPRAVHSRVAEKPAELR